MSPPDEGSDLTPLILDFVEWVARAPRLYGDVIGIWRTNCPRLTVWEESMERDLVTRRRVEGEGVWIEATDAGRALLARHGRSAAEPAVQR
ncbi:MAG: hypothetical protein ACMVY4_18945 [Minwuia sp.]|uniref:hypothetical protein n=1 Tax=Minwuia sp. TaxID=2493630 RepID=UPI003A836A78